ncbi:unnamed protein product [Orchesella dallaii]|uniref:Uncharacterized protein n=1 Tax=Orchesella dallaii TaxID=48710 RepID=A0ABP1QGD6_9HEXA
MLGSKISDLLLAEKNVVDFVDKNLLQERDRLKQDELETEFVCQHLVGGPLDYPVLVSHDFCDITTAWDVYLDAFTKATVEKLPKRHGSGIYPRPAEKNYRLGKMPFRGDELTIKQFMNAIVLCCPKIRNHIVECTEECTASGRLENVYVIISNIVIIRNYIWIFMEIFEYENMPKMKEEYKNFCELVEVISEQLLQFQANLLTTYILHDEQSQNWSSYQPYYEGERGSPTIQMWTYFLKAFQRDMWRIMPPQLAQRILAIIINDSLAILANRYSKIKPTEGTNPQFVCDIVNILATVEELLFYVCTDMPSVCGQADPSSSKVLFSIHLKCHCLAAALILVGCPLEILYKSFRRGLSTCCLFEARKKDTSRLTDVAWMSVLSFLCPNFYPTELEYTDWELLFSIKLLRAQPAVNWALVYKVVTMNNCKLATFILTLFPTVIAPANDFLLEGKAFQRCKHASCMEPDCHGLPKSVANHFVASCALYIIAHATSRDNMVTVYRSIFPRIKDWSAMDKTQIWNSSSRPVWFQCLVDVILPILKTCVQSLCLSISEQLTDHAKSNNTNTSHEVKTAGVLSDGNKRRPGKSPIDAVKDDRSTQWVIELLNTLTETLSVIPRGFFLVCEEMDDLIPRKFLPVRNNVPVHFLVTGLYMLLQIGSGIANSILPKEETKIPNVAPKISSKTSSKAGTKVEPAKNPSPTSILEPHLFSLAERLCHLDDPVFDQAIHRLISQIESMMKQTKAEKEESKYQRPFDYALDWEMSNLKSDFLLEEVEGQLSLRILYWFIITHGDVVEDAITGEIGGKSTIASAVANGVQSKDTHQTKLDIQVKNDDGSVNLGIRTAQDKTGEGNTDGKSRVLKIAPRIRTSLKNINIIHDFHYINRYRTFDEILWNSTNLDWVQTIRHCRMGLRKNVVAKLLERRWEMQPDLFCGITTGTDIKDEKMRHLYKMVDEIKALIMM